MVVHPTAATPHLAIISALAHGLALLSILLILLGTLGLTVVLNGPDRLAITALAVYAFATVAVLLAATVSGFIMPNLLNRMARDTPAAVAPWRIVIAAFFQINQAFSKPYSIAEALAIYLWSIACWHHGRAKAIATYGNSHLSSDHVPHSAGPSSPQPPRHGSSDREPGDLVRSDGPLAPVRAQPIWQPRSMNKRNPGLVISN